MDMRSLLKALMALRDENAYALEERSGVPQATINRFLTGKHGDPRSTTVRKWAGAYNLTESQLRGDAPLPDALMREIVRTAPEYADALLPSSNSKADDGEAQSPAAAQPTVADLLERLRAEISTQPEAVKRAIAELMAEYVTTPDEATGRAVADAILRILGPRP